MVTENAYKKYLDRVKNRNDDDIYGEEILSLDRSKKVRRPRSFQRALEDFVIQTIKSGKYVGLEEYSKKAVKSGRKTYKPGTSIQKIWLDQYESGRRGFESPVMLMRWLTKIGKADEFLDNIKIEWLKSHQKFVEFCELFKRDILSYFERTGKTEAAAAIKDIMEELDRYHKSKPGSLDIYSIDEAVIGMEYCLENVLIVRMTPDKKYLTFKKL